MAGIHHYLPAFTAGKTVTERQEGSKPHHCPACGSRMRGSDQAYRNWAWPTFDAFNALSLAVCDTCGLGMAVPDLSDATLGAFYGTVFRAMEGHVYLNFNRPPVSFFSHRAVAQVSLASAYCTFEAGDTFLDIGAGEGTSFYAARALLPSPKLVAIELAKDAETYYRRNVGAAVHSSLDHFVAAKKHAKIILLSHSLEHYRPSDIDKLFHDINDALASDGVLLIEVPHVDLKDHPEERPGDAPHLLFFTIPALSSLLEKYDFEVLFIRTCGDHMHVPETPDIEDKARRIRRWAVNAVRNILPNAIPRVAKLAKLAVRPEHAFAAVATAAYGGHRDCLRVVARKRVARTQTPSPANPSID